MVKSTYPLCQAFNIFIVVRECHGEWKALSERLYKAKKMVVFLRITLNEWLIIFRKSVLILGDMSKQKWERERRLNENIKWSKSSLLHNNVCFIHR